MNTDQQPTAARLRHLPDTGTVLLERILGGLEKILRNNRLVGKIP